MSESGEEFDMPYWPRTTTMRTLLFITDGAGKVRCWRTPSEYVKHPSRLSYHAECWRNHNPSPARCGATLAAVIRAKAWHLVECENADAGRTILICAEQHYNSCRCTPGRILASGGRHA